MTRPRLIGLTGYAGTGKDTVRQILEDQYDLDGLAFADPIREMLSVLLARFRAPGFWTTSRPPTTHHSPPPWPRAPPDPPP